MNRKNYMNQLVGVVVGSACGDALGARHEFHPAVVTSEPLEMGSGGAFDWRKGQWTDDTEQSIILLRELFHANDLDDDATLDSLARHFVSWAHRAQDIGNQTSAALYPHDEHAVTADEVFATAQAYLDSNPTACGNGGLMRTAPVAVGYLDEPERMMSIARSISRLTHPHIDSQDACAIWCMAIRTAILENRLDIRSAIDAAVTDAGRRAMWHDRFDLAEAAASPSHIPNNGGAVGAIQAAWRAVSVASNPTDAIENAVKCGGDTDTVGAIAGALAGARWGVSTLPARWRRFLNGWPYSSRDTSLPMQYRDLLTVAYLAGTKGLGTGGGGWPDIDDMGNRHRALVKLAHAERVWIGAEGDVDHLPDEVDAIVSLSRVGSEFAAGRVHVEFWLIDSLSPDANIDLEFVLTDAANTVAELVAEGHSVFLHCVAAHNRTPSVAALYLALHCGVDVDEAIRIVDEQCGNNGSNDLFRDTVRAIARRAEGER